MIYEICSFRNAPDIPSVVLFDGVIIYSFIYVLYYLHSWIYEFIIHTVYLMECIINTVWFVVWCQTPMGSLLSLEMSCYLQAAAPSRYEHQQVHTKGNLPSWSYTGWQDQCCALLARREFMAGVLYFIFFTFMLLASQGSGQNTNLVTTGILFVQCRCASNDIPQLLVSDI